MTKQDAYAFLGGAAIALAVLFSTVLSGCVTNPDGTRSLDTDLIRVGGELAIGAGREYVQYISEQEAAQLEAQLARQAELIAALERTIERLLAAQEGYE